MRDAEYVLDLCDEILGEEALREHCFTWLLGDPAPTSGSRRKLPVDAYYAKHALVIEYRERQHDEPVPFFDKPSETTISRVSRRVQRQRYDARRDSEIPKHGLTLLVIKPSDLDATARGRLRRHKAEDEQSLRVLLDPVLAKAEDG